jgi:hypothetical protein
LSLSCRVSYNTYAGYKSHIYRHHFDQLCASDNQIDVFEPSYINNILPLDPNNDNDTDHPGDDTDDFNTMNEEEDYIRGGTLTLFYFEKVK